MFRPFTSPNVFLISFLLSLFTCPLFSLVFSSPYVFLPLYFSSFVLPSTRVKMFYPSPFFDLSTSFDLARIQFFSLLLFQFFYIFSPPSLYRSLYMFVAIVTFHIFLSLSSLLCPIFSFSFSQKLSSWKDKRAKAFVPAFVAFNAVPHKVLINETPLLGRHTEKQLQLSADYVLHPVCSKQIKYWIGVITYK